MAKIDEYRAKLQIAPEERELAAAQSKSSAANMSQILDDEIDKLERDPASGSLELSVKAAEGIAKILLPVTMNSIRR